MTRFLIRAALAFLVGMAFAAICRADPIEPWPGLPTWPDGTPIDWIPSEWPQQSNDPPSGPTIEDDAHCAVIKACLESWDCLQAQSDATLVEWSTYFLMMCPGTTLNPPKAPKK